MRVITLWDSREDWDGFVHDRLAPYFERTGRPIPEFDISPVETVITY